MDDLGIVLGQMPEDTDFDRRSRDIYVCLGRIDHALQETIHELEIAYKGTFSLENLGIWNGLHQDLHTMIKHNNSARKRIRDMWKRTEIRKHHGGASDKTSPEGQKGSVCDE